MAQLEEKKCPVCGILYGVDADVMAYKWSRRSGGDDNGWYCPNGHYLVYTETEADRLKRERDRLAQQIAQRDDEINELNKRLSAQRGQVTRLRNRAKAGLCPCCNRHFTNLERHVATKHPDFQANEDAAA